MKKPESHQKELNPIGCTRIKYAFSLFGLSPSTGYRRIKDGTFPKPVKVSKGIASIRNSDLLEYSKDPANYKAKGQ